MNLVEARGLAKDWDGTPLFEEATFSITEGEKLGLVGPNGSGKTSLLGVLAGLDEDYRGSLKRKPGLRIGYAPQRWEPPSGLSCVEVLCAEADSLERELETRGEELGHLEGRALERALEAYGERRADFERLGAEEAADRAARLLGRLGLPEAADLEASRLSGGEKNILALALALTGDPELLILDEPGNHLDFDGLDWLEDFIRGERRAVLVVSHNRWLLDRSVDAILDLDARRLTRYAGGFSRYRVEKLKAQAGQGRDWEAGKRKVERLENLVRRFEEIARSRPDPAWGKRLRARRSQLERAREDAVSRPEASRRRMDVGFSGPGSRADFAFIARDYRKAYGDRVLFEGASLELLPDERVALVGPNGSGKTSFLRDVVAASGSLDGGPLRVGPSMRLAYCAQEDEAGRGERTVGEEFRAAARAGAAGNAVLRDADLEKLLRRFLFPQGILERRIGELSGGERKRLDIARACQSGANFLILDEPTNHLDIDGREALEEGLADFEGCLLVVSHDRWFLEAVAERVVLIEEGGFSDYEGGFAEFWRDRGRAQATARRLGSRGGGSGGASGAASLEGRAAALDRARREEAKGAARRSAGGRDLETRIEEAEREKLACEAESAKALQAGDYARAAAAAEKAQTLMRLVERLFEEWVKV